MYQVIVLRNGSCKDEHNGYIVYCTITLIKGEFNVLVDPGGYWDQEVLVKGLKENDLDPADIDYVICSHGHSDHIGNLHLFPKAIKIISNDVSRGNVYFKDNPLKKGEDYVVDENLRIISTPGHTCNDISVLVETKEYGKVIVAGDIFECEEDIENPSLWMENCEMPSTDKQEESRRAITKMANYIVPGHGAMFQVKK
ncbi:DgyrCDS8438 [Dimorphilus gyrociliatus]|uniref:Metallo-beta-lactamase domain-containing protein 1 n=1 Tax=Dimorphilus gyrociliatus TaxID=2664684 RepID=A0A7I8VZ97_9ANNE|nr:DgyrCDS8438 [Dimorphilus gyrociliatus]